MPLAAFAAGLSEAFAVIADTFVDTVFTAAIAVLADPPPDLSVTDANDVGVGPLRTTRHACGKSAMTL